MKPVLLICVALILCGCDQPDRHTSAAPKTKVASAPAAHDNPLPAKVGACATTAIKTVGSRLEDSSTGKVIAGSGSAIVYTNGGYQVSYDQIPAMDKSMPGDGVNICLVSIPSDCPPGDARGRVYKTTNLRTGGVWEEADSEHMCGGA